MSQLPAEIVLYGRPGCHLCEESRALLDALLENRASLGMASPPVVERSIEDNDELHRRYALVIPVVSIGGRDLELATKPAALRRFLAEALDGATAEAPRA